MWLCLNYIGDYFLSVTVVFVWSYCIYATKVFIASFIFPQLYLCHHYMCSTILLLYYNCFICLTIVFVNFFSVLFWLQAFLKIANCIWFGQKIFINKLNRDISLMQYIPVILISRLRIIMYFYCVSSISTEKKILCWTFLMFCQPTYFINSCCKKDVVF